MGRATGEQISEAGFAPSLKSVRGFMRAEFENGREYQQSFRRPTAINIHSQERSLEPVVLRLG